ncbi:MAG: ATP-binding cassette domain-containing protein [Thermoanaerobaculia bacterium]|nr:ATP-binding cassette domain-containing protein [Thermoanaerobaculia bacterium]
MPTTAALEIVDVRKRFGTLDAVASLSVQVPAGSVFGLLGPNGSGKTTTIRMIMDIIAPDSGEIRFQGRRRRPDDLDRIGYLPEERGLYRRMTPIDQLVFLGELHGMPAADARQRAEEWLERVGLADRARRRIEELSKGMQQKIQLVGTLLHEPELIILDEPFSGLDPINQSLFKETLAEHKAKGKSILFSTHILEQAEKLCDHICLIAGGRAILTGSLTEIKRRYGGNTYRLTVRDDTATVPEVEGVVSLLRFDDHLRLELADHADPVEVLRRLVGELDVRSFRSEEPDLEEIFVRAVREAGSEVEVEPHELRA